MWRHVTHSRSASEVASRSTAARQLTWAVRQALGGSPGSLTDSPFLTCHRLQSSTPLASSFHPSDAMEGASVSVSMNVESSRQRAVMKTLLNTLQAAADQRIREMTNPWASHVVERRVIELPVSFVTPADQQLCSFTTECAVSVEQLHHDEVEEEEHNPEPEKHEKHEAQVFNADAVQSAEEIQPEKSEKQKPLLPKPTLQGRLIRALTSHRLKQAVELFNKAVQLDYKLDPKVLHELFDILVFKDAVTAYNVLRRYREQENRPMNPAMYAKLCGSVGRHRPRQITVHHLRHMVKRLGRELSKLDKEKFQHICYPRLVVSLVKQQDGALGRAAYHIYEHMLKNNFPLTAEMLEECLKYSRYSRQEDLPYPEILRDLVAWGHRPFPPNAIQVLQNLFPFTDVKKTSMALKALLELQSTTQPTDRHQNYRVDLGTLEQITASGARKASPELNLMVWDLMEVLGYRPTEAMYENTIQAFCMSYRQDDNVFAVLAEMESSGYEPSRALIRSISRSLRFSPGRTDYAYYMVTQGDNELTRVSVASLNAILSACGELGDVDRAFATYDDFASYELKPNTDSFSFLLEALAVNIRNSASGDKSMTESDMLSQVDAAESIMDMVKENGSPGCRHGLHEYVRILCFAGNIDGAISAVDDAFERKEEVANKTIFVLASECLSAGRVDAARDLASKTSEPWTFLEKRIANTEQNSKSQPSPDSEDYY